MFFMRDSNSVFTSDHYTVLKVNQKCLISKVFKYFNFLDYYSNVFNIDICNFFKMRPF